MLRRAFIIGGTGQSGRAVADEPLSSGWKVACASRGGREQSRSTEREGVTCILLDRSEPGALRRAIGSGADWIVHQTLLAKKGVRILEGINTAPLIADGQSEFIFVLGQPAL